MADLGKVKVVVPGSLRLNGDFAVVELEQIEAEWRVADVAFHRM